MKKHTITWLSIWTIPMVILAAIPLSGCGTGSGTPRVVAGETPSDRAPPRVHDLSFTLRGVRPRQPEKCDSPVPASRVPYDRIETGCPAGTEYFASRTEGERQLQELAGTVVPEDAWVYFESYSLWIDVGENPDADSVVTNFDPVREALESAPIPPSELHLYLLHPVRASESDQIAPPRVPEICTYVTMERDLRLRFDLSLALHVIDRSGIWTCQATPGGSEWTVLPNIVGRPILRGPKSGEVPHHLAIELMRDLDARRLSTLAQSLDTIGHDSSLERDQRIAAYLKAARQAGISEVYTRG